MTSHELFSGIFPQVQNQEEKKNNIFIILFYEGCSLTFLLFSQMLKLEQDVSRDS